MHETIFHNNEDKTWVDFAKQHKGFFVKNTKRGDLPPTIIAERNGEVFAIVIASDIDKELALKASDILRHGAGADSLVLILDAHVRTMDKDGEDEFLKNYKHGDMQRACDEEGACELGLISDCLVCHRIDKDGKIDCTVMTYSYHGEGTEFKWTDEGEKYPKDMTGVGGYIPDVLREIMAKPTFTENDKLMKTAREHGFEEERIFYHTARATFQLLMENGYYLIDMLSGKHPEWCNAAEKAEQIILTLSDKEVIPKVAVPALAKIAAEHIGKPSFQVEFAKILVKYKHRFAKEHSEIPDQAESFANWVHQESFIVDKPPQAGAGERKEPPYRVRVWNGDRSEFLGEGEYIGNVTVYFVRTESGISSAKNAEQKPDNVPEDDIVEAPNNPKIVLDNGQVVYGCQVWWEPAEEATETKPQPQSKWPGPKNKKECDHEGCGCGE